MVQARPDAVLISKHLLLFASELKKATVGVKAAVQDLRNKLSPGLPPGHYGTLPYLLEAAQSGYILQFCSISRDGEAILGHSLIPGVLFCNFCSACAPRDMLEEMAQNSVAVSLFHLDLSATSCPTLCQSV